MKNESNDSANTPVSGENETPTRFESTTATGERWLPVPGYEGHYEVSDLGRVRSLKYGKTKLRRQITDAKGYKFVDLSVDGVRSTRKVHRLVLEAFVGPCPDGCQTCHYDGVRTNNKLSNLRWGTPQDNTMDQIRHGSHISARKLRGSQHPSAKLTDEIVVEIKRRLGLGEYQRVIAEDYGVDQTLVSMVKLGKCWRHLDS